MPHIPHHPFIGSSRRKPHESEAVDPSPLPHRASKSQMHTYSRGQISASPAVHPTHAWLFRPPS